MKAPTGDLEISIVIPCLNEEESLPTALAKAQAGIAAAGVPGEVIVADNGSTDRSPEIARNAGARVVQVKDKGYGNALMGGIAEARGRFVMMGDADGSYDFSEAPKFYAKFREGYELVQGCRLPWGGGRVMPGAMPFLHRWLGNPMLTRLARILFKTPVHDIYCGLRGFDRNHYLRLQQRCTGMEFAVEMIIKSALVGAKTAEVPITLHPDLRIKSAPHLRTFRDGWRTVRFFMISSPNWLYSVPAVLIGAFGVLAYLAGFLRLSTPWFTLGVHTQLCAAVLILLAFQLFAFGVFARTYAISEGILPLGERMKKLYLFADLEKALIASVAMGVFGILAIARVFAHWVSIEYAPLDYAEMMKWVITGVLLIALAMQLFFSGFLVSLLGMPRKA